MTRRSTIAAMAMTLVVATGLSIGAADARTMPSEAAYMGTVAVGSGMSGLASAMEVDAKSVGEHESYTVAQRRFRRGVATGLAIGLGAAIIGGAISRDRAYGYEDEIEDAMHRCAERFRSFSWERGTYVTYGGEERLCPYLRPYVD